MSRPPETRGLRISGVRLVNCQFERHFVEPGEGERSLEFDLDTEYEEHSGDATVIDARQWVRVSGICSGTKLWNCKTEFAATLTISEPSDVSIDQAKKSIAPAILYGFAREHIFDLARRAGIGGAFMPPLNFMAP